MSAADLQRSSFAGCAAVVLGAEAVERLRPAEISAILGSSRARVVLSPDACLPHVLAAWVKAGFGDVVAPADLADHLRRMPARPRLGPSEWLEDSPPPGSPGFIAAAAVDELERFHVDDWAAALGWRRGRLLGVCRLHLGKTAKELLLTYVVRSAEALRAAGITRADSAVVLGYSSAGALCAALGVARRRGLRPHRSNP